MNYQIEHLAPTLEEVLDFITNGDKTETPEIKPLQYGQVISPQSLNKLNITSDDPASIINPFLSDLSADINNPEKNGDYNCLLYHNKLGLVDDYSKDPLICSNNVQSKCTLSEFSDAHVLGVTDTNKKTYNEYNTFIGPNGLQL